MNNMPDCCYDYRHEAPRRTIVETCMHCGDFIYTGEEYYDIRGMVFCKDCIDDFKKVGDEE